MKKNFFYCVIFEMFIFILNKIFKDFFTYFKNDFYYLFNYLFNYLFIC